MSISIAVKISVDISCDHGGYRSRLIVLNNDMHSSDVFFETL